MKKARKKSKPVPTSCPCSSGRSYAECCQPFHRGEKAPTTAVDCMRSRYSALALGLTDYLWNTLHSQHADRSSEPSGYQDALARACRSNRYRSLRVLDSSEPDPSGAAQVLFYAQVERGKQDRSFVELSTFVQEDGAYRYITGVARSPSALSHGLDQLTIDHWDCAHHHH